MGWLADRAYDLGKGFVWGLDGLYGRASVHGDRHFFDNDDFPWVGGVEAAWEGVRDEFAALLPHAADLPNFQDISRHQAALSQDDGWKTYFFYAYGLKAEANCRRCPKTAALLESIPGMTTAFYSVFAPGKHLPPHRGPYKGVLRVHLALMVPEPAEKCGIRVGDEIRHWHEGKVMVFDDTFVHEAWNDTDAWRAVLFIDVKRPMRFPVNLINDAMVKAIAASPFVRGQKGGYEAWERRFERKVEEKTAEPS